MPSPNPTTTRDFKGAAKATTLSAQIVNGTDTTFTVADATGWPDGSGGKFVATVNAGLSDEEKILCLSRSGTTITKDTRGFDGTTAAGHAAGATVIHSLSAFDAAEWNAHTAATSGVHGVAGAVVGTTDTQVLTNKSLTSPAFTGTATGLSATSATLDAASTHGGVSGTSLAADRTAWTTYTPTFTNCTSPTGEFAYKQIGKTLHIRGMFTGGTATATSVIAVGLPISLTAAGASGIAQFVAGWNGNTWSIIGTGGTNALTSSVVITAAASLSSVGFAGVIEVA